MTLMQFRRTSHRIGVEEDFENKIDRSSIEMEGTRRSENFSRLIGIDPVCRQNIRKETQEAVSRLRKEISRARHAKDKIDSDRWSRRWV